MDIEIPDIDIKGLVEEVERLLQEAKGTPEYLGDINWRRLKVERVECSFSIWPESGVITPDFIVSIGPAAPGCLLEIWLYNHLDKKRFPGDIYFECGVL